MSTDLQWYWGARSISSSPGVQPRLAGDGFVVARGQDFFWHRVRYEVDPDEHCLWNLIGKHDAEPTLAHCVTILLKVRESYGVNFNRAMTELAQVKAFARFLYKAPTDLCNLISNGLNCDPLPRVAYDPEVRTRLGKTVAETLQLKNERGWD